MKIFICDNCSKEFPNPLDEEQYKDEHGVWHTFDLCAPCRREKELVEVSAKKSFIDKMGKKK